MNKLPELPKKNKALEAKFGLRFRDWIMKNPRTSCTFEMKDTRGKNYLPFSEVKQKQIDYGLVVSGDEGVLMRIEPIVEGMPDYAYYRNSPAYIVIKYPKFFCLVTVGTFLHEKNKSKVKSLTSSRAKDIAVLVVMS